MDLPPVLKSNISDGTVILILGTGALNNGTIAPYEALRTTLAEQFLDDAKSLAHLDEIVELCLTEVDTVTLQEFVRKQLECITPSDNLRLVPRLRWRGIATINVDLAIEKAFYENKDRQQNLVSFIDNTDRVEELLRRSDALQFLKLHGCISRTTSPTYPFFLSTDQYDLHPHCRNHVFNTLFGWARENIIVFVGDQTDDRTIRTLTRLIRRDVSNPRRAYYVRSNPNDIITRHWEKLHVQVLDGDLGTFMAAAIGECGKLAQGIKAQLPNGSMPIQDRFVVRDARLSDGAIQFLTTDVDYVKHCQAAASITPSEFFRGNTGDWAPIQQSLDVRRGLTDTILKDYFLDSEEGDRTAELLIVQSHAGAGKSVFLRRLAWDAAFDFDRLCLFLTPYGRMNSAAIEEICDLAKERVYLFVDDAQYRVRALVTTVRALDSQNVPVTIVAAVRRNEWNMFGDAAEDLITDRYDLNRLTDGEVDVLLGKLEQHNALGHLAKLPRAERRGQLVEHAGRQLLVALHEATLGDRFPNIIEDEFNKIRPEEAQRIYLSVCVMHRLGIPVRAGVLKRIHDIDFEEFKQRRFAPLEGIVHTSMDPVIRDRMFRARHPEIAQMVFERLLGNEERRFEEYIRCLKALNLSFEVDQDTFDRMVRARSLVELFSNSEMIDQIYLVAESVGGDEVYLLHQRSLYLSGRATPDLSQAEELLRRALRRQPTNAALRHSHAELILRRADSAKSHLEKTHLLDDAAKIAGGLTRETKTAHPYATLIKIQLRRLEICVGTEEIDERTIQSRVQDCEELLSEGLQRFPDSPSLLQLESDLSLAIQDSPRSIAALRKAFDVSHRASGIARRLARALVATKDATTAELVLRQALDVNPTDRPLRYAYARLLLEDPKADSGAVLYHIGRSYNPGDRNYDAQILHIRELYRQGQIGQYRDLVFALSRYRAPFHLRRQPQWKLEDFFTGTIQTVEAGYLFVRRDGTGDDIYVHRSNVGCSDEIWRQLVRGARVKLRIGFTLKGATGVEIVMVP